MLQVRSRERAARPGGTTRPPSPAARRRFGGLLLSAKAPSCCQAGFSCCVPGACQRRAGCAILRRETRPQRNAVDPSLPACHHSLLPAHVSLIVLKTI